MQSKDVLKNALLQYEGSMILVSHDRDFLQGLSEKVFEFKDHQLKTYIGDVYDFLEKKKIDTLNELQIHNKKTAATNKKESSNKESWERKKEIEAQARKIKNQISKIEKEIEALQKEIVELEDKMGNPEKYATEIASGELYEQYQSVKDQLAIKEEEWMNLADE